ncbi:pro-resilin-like [Penaeus monodon]|uniref:pro-resilin-like n=1 Tax=Penaeus monodon TaxID=6687 RepID=UPI0018A7DB12|nr:pro-resilin-like [Penaeus monodon]
MKAVILVLTVASTSWATSPPVAGYDYSGPYSFQWDVNDAPSRNFYGHGEKRQNDDTQGRYYVQLPDGRRLVVEYFVDSAGFHPTVSFEGEITAGGQGQYGGQGGGGQYGGQGGGSGGFGQGQGSGFSGSGAGSKPSLAYGTPSKQYDHKSKGNLFHVWRHIGYCDVMREMPETL